MRRNHEVRIKLSQQEAESLKKKAFKLGISQADFVRMLINAAETPLIIRQSA